MELWIRSQNKEELVNSHLIFVRKYTESDNNLQYKITCIENKEHRGWCNLGVYATKERALEVLDEIQSKIKSKQLIETKNTYDWSSDKLIECRTLAETNHVYEMPLE